MKGLRNLGLLIALMHLSLSAFSQGITVIDRLTQERIPGVKIYCLHGDQRTIANSEGGFLLDGFETCDSLVISYSGYSPAIYAYRDLRSLVVVELEEVQLDVKGVVVTASRWEGDITEVPNRVTSIDPKSVLLENPQTSADLLASSGYVYVQKSQFSGGSPQLRGYGTNRVMIVVDGVRMNNAIFRSGNVQNVISIDPLSLSGVEVFYGPGSVMFGSDAIGGVMEFSTLKARFAPDTTQEFIHTNTFARYNSASNEITGHVDFNYGNERFSAATAITYSYFGDLVTGSRGDSAFLRPTFQQGDQTLINSNPRKQIRSGYDQFNALQKFSFRPKEGVEWNYGFLYATNFRDSPRYDRLTVDADNDGDLDYEEWYYGPQEWMMNHLSYSNSNAQKMYDQFRVVGAVQMFEESRNDRRTGSSQIRRQFEAVNAYSINVDFEKKFGSKTELFYGVESVVNTVNSNAFREHDNGTVEEINPRYPDGSLWQVHGIYGSLKHRLNEKWVATVGARYALFSANARFDTTLFVYPITEANLMNTAPSASMGIVFKPSDKMRSYLNLSSGFRAPNIDDIGKVFDSQPGVVVVPNPEIKPEFAYAAEIGMVKVIKSRFKLDVAVYASYLKNVLVRAPFQLNGQDSILYEGVNSSIEAIQNESNAYTYGVQAGFDWAIVKGLNLSSTLSFQRGFQFDSDSSAYFPKAQVAPVFGRVSLKYRTRQLRMEAYWVYNGEVSHDQFPLGERDELNYALDANGNVYTPSWNTFNFKASFFFNKHVSMSAGLENITNVLYRTYGSGITAAGRSIIYSVKVSF